MRLSLPWLPDFWTGLVYVLLMAFAATVPVWSYSVDWGDHPSELIGLAITAVMIRILLKRP